MYNFVMEFSNFPPGLALHGLQCGVMIKVRDNAKSSLDVCRAEYQLLTLSCPGFFGHFQPGGCLVPPPVIPLSDLQST